MKTILKAFLVGMLLLLSATAYGQSFDSGFSTAYENALLDSLIRYEKLKPTYAALQTAYSYQGKEVESLRNALRVSELLTAVQKEQYEHTLTGYRRKLRWARIKGQIVTAVVIVGTTIYIVALRKP